MGNSTACKSACATDCAACAACQDGSACKACSSGDPATSTAPTSPFAPNDPTVGTKKGKCRLRLVAVNDVYELENLARLKTCMRIESEGWPTENVFSTLAGDFLAPSLISSLDAGHGMVRVLNEVPMHVVCFGNHESDVPYHALRHRIEEYKGVWLNSNMPDFVPRLPVHHAAELVGDDGTPNARVVAFVGLCLGGGKFKATYRPDAFGGAASSMIPVLEAAESVCTSVRQARKDVDEIIALTHQNMDEDILLAKLDLFPVIVAGHDHEVFHEVHGSRNCPIIKAGMDATNVALIDLVWSDESDAKPEVTVSIKDIKCYEPDTELASMIEEIYVPVRALDATMLYEIKAGEWLSSVGVRMNDASMARKITTCLRDMLGCDGALINSGAVRGNKEYHDTISFGDLKRECPFPSPIVVTQMPFAVLQEAVRVSRKEWWDFPPGGERKESRSALQVDYGMKIGEDHNIKAIYCLEPDMDELYHIACDSTVLRKNPVLSKYSKEFPERIPPDDAGRPLLAILMEYFLGQIWMTLTNVAISAARNHRGSNFDMVDCAFDLIDINKDGYIDYEELAAAIREHCGEAFSSNIVVSQLLAMFDTSGDGMVSRHELLRGLLRVIGGPQLEGEMVSSVKTDSQEV